jgi:hypothetical protein
LVGGAAESCTGVSHQLGVELVVVERDFQNRGVELVVDVRVVQLP